MICTYFHLSCSSSLSGLRSHLKPPSQDSGNFKVVAFQNDWRSLLHILWKNKIQMNTLQKFCEFYWVIDEWAPANLANRKELLEAVETEEFFRQKREGTGSLPRPPSIKTGILWSCDSGIQVSFMHSWMFQSYFYVAVLLSQERGKAQPPLKNNTALEENWIWGKSG